jgi:DnaJ-class molecular chaperone
MSAAHDPKPTAAKRARKAPASSEHDDEQEAVASAEETHEPRVCVPCHGTGKVISNLGGHASKVTCPWCRGGGERLTGMDAQEWQQEQAKLKRH